MKQLLFLSLIPLVFNYPIVNGASVSKTEIESKLPISKNLIAKKWYLNKTLVNNTQETSSTEETKDYFHFLSNGSCIFYESTFETKEIGKWTVQNNRLIVKVDSETRTFIIESIDSKSLHLKVSTDDPIIELFFSR